VKIEKRWMSVFGGVLIPWPPFSVKTKQITVTASLVRYWRGSIRSAREVNNVLRRFDQVEKVLAVFPR
jgi:hypothetical protein